MTSKSTRLLLRSNPNQQSKNILNNDNCLTSQHAFSIFYMFQFVPPLTIYSFIFALKYPGLVKLYTWAIHTGLCINTRMLRLAFFIKPNTYNRSSNLVNVSRSRTKSPPVSLFCVRK